MSSIISEGKEIISEGKQVISEGKQVIQNTKIFVREKLHDTIIRNSIYSAIVFTILAHPLTFKFIDNIIKVQDSNLQTLVHATVFALFMYFGSIYIFLPIQKILFE